MNDIRITKDNKKIIFIAVLVIVLFLLFKYFNNSYENLDVVPQCQDCQTCPNIVAANQIVIDDTQKTSSALTNLSSSLSQSNASDVLTKSLDLADTAVQIATQSANFEQAKKANDFAKQAYEAAISAYNLIQDPAQKAAAALKITQAAQAIVTTSQIAASMAPQNQSAAILKDVTDSQKNLSDAIKTAQNTITSIASNCPPCVCSGSSGSSDKPPVTDGLMAFYDSRSVQQDKFKDLVGSYDGTIVGMPPTVSNKIIEATKETRIYFPREILPKGYTLFTVAKYNGSNRSRIFTAANAPFWFSGFYGGQAGLTHHGNWVTNNTSVDSNNWVLSTDQKALYRANGKDYTSPSSTELFDNVVLAINPEPTNPFGSAIDDASDFAVKCVIVYNKELSTNDILKVEAWIASTYMA